VSREEEKLIFERFIDFVMDRLKQYPDLHIYHYAPYEPAALKRLMGRYACREEEIDFLLRSKCFVDLYSVVRNGLRASVESYSIKKLKPLYGFTRGTPLSDANMALTKVQACLELGDIEFINEDDRNAVTGYNRDDCISTWQLRDWLETQRANLISTGGAVPRPAATEGAPSEAVGDWVEKISALIARLTVGICLARWSCCFLHGPPNPFRDEPGKWLDVHLDARAFERLQIRRAVFDPHDCPWVSARSEHRVHEKARRTAVAVWIGVNVTEEPVAQNSAHRGLRLLLDQIEERGHRVRNSFCARRHMPGAAQENRLIPIASERTGP